MQACSIFLSSILRRLLPSFKLPTLCYLPIWCGPLIDLCPMVNLIIPIPWKETTICPPMSRARCSAPRSLYLFGTVGWLSVRGRVFICVSSVIMGETAVFWRHCIIEEEEANRICRVGQAFFLRNPVSGEPFLPALK